MLIAGDGCNAVLSEVEVCNSDGYRVMVLDTMSWCQMGVTQCVLTKCNIHSNHMAGVSVRGTSDPRDTGRALHHRLCQREELRCACE